MIAYLTIAIKTAAIKKKTMIFIYTWRNWFLSIDSSQIMCNKCLTIDGIWMHHAIINATNKSPNVA